MAAIRPLSGRYLPKTWIHTCVRGVSMCSLEGLYVYSHTDTHTHTHQHFSTSSCPLAFSSCCTATSRISHSRSCTSKNCFSMFNQITTPPRRCCSEQLGLEPPVVSEKSTVFCRYPPRNSEVKIFVSELREEYFLTAIVCQFILSICGTTSKIFQ